MKANHRFFVVIHTVALSFKGLDHAIDQTQIAKDNGADGIFLIPDYAKGSEMRATISNQFLYLKAAQRKFPDFPIGVNFLQNLAGIKDDIYTAQPRLLQTDSSTTRDLDRNKLPSTQLFCGVAFKYSSYETATGDKLRDHCRQVAENCDVPTTSGKATGVAADIDKIRTIVSHLPQDKRLGIASGVTEENVDSYLGAGVTDFLVATSLVSKVDALSRDILDPEKVARLAAKTHS